MRVALVYDRLNKIGGAEQVLIAFNDLFPHADWYTSVWDKQRAPFSQYWPVRSSFINKIGLLRTHHEWIPFLMPFIFESFDFGGYDLVISIGSAESKGIITRPATIHIHYCLTPTRYLYSHKEEYLSNRIYRAIGNILTKWDKVASTRPDEMIAISTQVKKRIKKYYNKDVEVIFPPVNTKKFHLPLKNWNGPKDYFLVVSRLVAYKRIDTIIKAANESKTNLIIVGDGVELSRLKKIAGPSVTFAGYIDNETLPGYYQNCRAYIQANEEDFGISMVEALASGKPVIAYGQGGARDIINIDTVGLLLESKTVQAFAKAMSEFDTMCYVAADCVKTARRFDTALWSRQIKERIDQICRQNQISKY